MSAIEAPHAAAIPDTGLWTDDARALWRRIRTHRLDVAGAALPFTQRLARDNHWSAAFAAAVVEEYRRFAFLAVVAGHPVTPSDEVDQAWHLHLLYTRDYWERFCPHVLGRPLHHGPTEGGAAQGQLFDEQYSRTRHSYHRWFGAHPPSAIWPGAATRFDRDTRWVRVNREDVYVIRRVLPEGRRVVARLRGVPARIWNGTRNATRRLLAGGCAALLSAGAAAQDLRPDSLIETKGNPYGLSAGAFLLFFAAACLAALIVTVILGITTKRRVARGRGLDQQPDGPLETAMLCGDESRVLLTALTALADGGFVRVVDGKLVAESAPPEAADPIVRKVYAVVCDEQQADIVLARAKTRVGDELAAIRTSLEDKELMTRRGSVPTWPLWLGALLPVALALPRIGLAIEAERPFGFLVVLCIVFFFANLLFHQLTWRGSRHYTQGGQQARRELRRHAKRAKTDPGVPLPHAAAVLGAGVLVGTHLSDLGATLAPAAGSGTDGSSGCGDGGGGGGCGGGGCGG